MISDSEKLSLKVGLKQVKKSLAAGKASKVFIAEDCDMYLRESLDKLCAEASITPVYVRTMAELGRECGINVKASCACVC